MIAFSKVNSLLGQRMEIWWVSERDYDVSRILRSSVLGIEDEYGYEKGRDGRGTSVACGSVSWVKVLLTALGDCFM